MNDVSSKTVVLLATLNGEEYIKEQINSILGQSWSGWKLIIRDDGSVDNTVRILQEYAVSDSRIRLIDDLEKSGSARGSFARLAEEGLKTDGEVFLFCDQDDIWHPRKLESQVKRLMAMGDRSHPALVHHDLIVVDENGEVLRESFFDYMKLSPMKASFISLLGRNEITGCTIACNRSLLQCAVPFPEQAIMHDWWLGLVSAALGEVAVVDAGLVWYRQHGKNTIGASSFWHGLNPLNNPCKTWLRGNKEFLSTVLQAKTLKKHIEEKGLSKRVGEEKLRALETYAALMEKPRIKRLILAQRYGFNSSHWFLRLTSRGRLLTLKNPW